MSIKKNNSTKHIYISIEKKSLSKTHSSSINNLDDFHESDHEIVLSGKVLLAGGPNENDFIIEFFKNQNVELTVVSNGVNIFELIKTNTYDLLLMDAHASGKNGVEAIQLIREYEIEDKIQKNKIIALTQYASKEDQSKILESGYDGFLSKPIKMKNLLEILAEHLSSYSGEKTLFTDEEIEKDLAEYLPTYIQNRWKDYKELVIAKDQNDFDFILKICHKILGSAQTYGLYFLDDIIKNLQKHARNRDLSGIESRISELEEYLRSAN